MIIESIQVGKTITFGNFYKQNDLEFEPLEWIVLDKNNNELLLITRYAISDTYFDSNPKIIVNPNLKEYFSDWKKSTLRAWANDSFYNSAFAPDEKSKILLSKLILSSNHIHDSGINDETDDRIFILSNAEYNAYLKDKSYAKCRPTPYTLEKANCADSYGYCRYWLRTPGKELQSACFVDYDGSINLDGTDIHNQNDHIGIRLAMWIDISEELALINSTEEDVFDIKHRSLKNPKGTPNRNQAENHSAYIGQKNDYIGSGVGDGADVGNDDGDEYLSDTDKSQKVKAQMEYEQKERATAIIHLKEKVSRAEKIFIMALYSIVAICFTGLCLIFQFNIIRDYQTIHSIIIVGVILIFYYELEYFYHKYTKQANKLRAYIPDYSDAKLLTYSIIPAIGVMLFLLFQVLSELYKG